MLYIEALRFNQPNFKAHEQLELLLLEALALASNDFADEIEYLKLIIMMVIVSSRYYGKGIFQQANELDPKNFPGAPNLRSLIARFLAHPHFVSLRGPCCRFMY